MSTTPSSVSDKSAYIGLIGYCAIGGLKGENGPQSPATLYEVYGEDSLALTRFNQLSGEVPSTVLLTDIDRALQTLTHIAAAFERNKNAVPLMAVGVKHGNACGAAVGSDPEEILRRTIAGDPNAVMDGTIMANFAITAEMAGILRRHLMTEGRRVIDAIVAPEVGDGVVAEMDRKDNRGRVFINPALADLDLHSLDRDQRIRQVRGGFLTQGNYTYVLDLYTMDMERFGSATGQQELDMLLAWAVCATSNSNTITLVRDGMLIGNGVGQQDRVGAAELALTRARYGGHGTNGAVAASDSFFPFPDGAMVLANAGVSAIFATKGGKNFHQVATTLQEAGVVFYAVPDDIGRGFFGH